MGFIGDALSNVGHVFGIGGGVNQFQGQNANYLPAIQGAISGAQGADAGMQGFITALQNQAAGNGPSVAQELLKRSLDANNANAASSVSSVRGLNPALAQKLILDQQAQQNQQATGQGATLRAQEMLGTQGLLGQALSSRMAGNTGFLGTLAGANQGQNQIAAGVAGQNAGITANAIGGLLNGIGGAVGMKSISMAPGGVVPGQPAVAGDSPKNDTEPIMASPGEIVLPRSVAQAEDAPERAAAFVRAIRRQKEPEGYGKALSRMRELDGRLKRVEAMCAGGRVAA